MNIIILAGGEAERLWPLTKTIPKTLLDLAGYPILHHVLRRVKNISRVDSITVAIDKDKQREFEESLPELDGWGDTARPMLAIHSFVLGHPMGPLAKLDSILRESDRYNIEGDDFLVIGGDNIFGSDLRLFCDFYFEMGCDCIATSVIRGAQSPREYGMLRADSLGKVEEFYEKPDSTDFEQIGTCCYCLSRNTLSEVGDYLAEGVNDDLGSFIRWQIQEQHDVVHTFALNGEWFDIGTGPEMLKASAHLIGLNPTEPRRLPMVVKGGRFRGKVIVHPTASIEDSLIGPDAYIGEKVSIKDSTIVNSIIYGDCEIRNATVVDSIIGHGSTCDGHAKGVLLGPGAQASFDT